MLNSMSTPLQPSPMGTREASETHSSAASLLLQVSLQVKTYYKNFISGLYHSPPLSKDVVAQLRVAKGSTAGGLQLENFRQQLEEGA